jgi:hypothetical protein
LSQKEIEESLNLLQKDWDIDPILRQFMLGKITDVNDYSLKVKDVILHQKKNISCGNVFGLTVITAVTDKADCH